jgi:plasmid stabilization system protein ParE
VSREVVFAPEAQADLFQLYDCVAADSGTARAQRYTDRIVAHCIGLVNSPERGRRRDDLRPGTPDVPGFRAVRCRVYLLILGPGVNWLVSAGGREPHVG